VRRDTQIRFTKNDRKEYARLVRNTKAKIKRTIANYGINLTNEIKIPSIEEFTSRKEFNDFKDKQKVFTNRANRNYQFVKNEFNVVATKKEVDTVKRNTEKAQKIAEKITKNIEQKPSTLHGTVGQLMKQMAKPESMTGISRPKDFDFEKIRTRKQFEDKMKNMEERANERFYSQKMIKGKEAWMKLVEETFNASTDVMELLEQIPPDDFYELYLQEDAFSFNYFYTEEEGEAQIEKIKAVVERYNDGKINMELKGF
jgi:hypothetical protein